MDSEWLIPEPQSFRADDPPHHPASTLRQQMKIPLFLRGSVILQKASSYNSNTGSADSLKIRRFPVRSIRSGGASPLRSESISSLPPIPFPGREGKGPSRQVHFHSREHPSPL